MRGLDHARRAGQRFTDVAARLLAAGGRTDGRILLAGAVAAYLGAVTVAWVAFDLNLWVRLGVWAAETPFYDARNITAAVECRALGHDPLVANPCDPGGRPMNYPRLWLALGALGVDQSWTIALGVTFAAVFLVALYRFVGRITVGQGIVLAVAVCSPAAMLAVERGQSDLLMFALLAGAVVLWRRGSHAARMASPLLVLAAAVLKLFPVFALGAYLLARERRAAAVAGACLTVFAGYAVVTLGDLRAMAHALPQQRSYSYGAHILFSGVLERLGMSDLAFGPAPRVLGLATLAGLAGAAWWWSGRRSPRPADDRHPPMPWETLAFHFGALVYLGTFATVSNWDYRLIFLILAVPQLARWVAEADDVRAPAVLSLILVVLYSGNLLADELGNWLLTALLLTLTMPAVREAGSWWLAVTRSASSRLPARR